ADAKSIDAARYRESILPLLTDHCFDCHGNGSAEGNLRLDAAGEDAPVDDRRVWLKVLQNVRAGVMPPPDASSLDAEQRESLAEWIKCEALGIDRERIDPGPPVVRRLNRFEYGNTIRDLMGIDFNVEVLFPPDDSAFGFDNVGDAQTLSPLLVEKYLQAAEAIVAEAVPTQTRVLQYQEFDGWSFHDAASDRRGNSMSVDEETHAVRTLDLSEGGKYRVTVRAMVNGSFGFHPRRCTTSFSIDGAEQCQDEYGWAERQQIEKTFELEFEPGEHRLAFDVTPIERPVEETGPDDFLSDEPTHAYYHLHQVKVEGPLDPPVWSHPPNYERFFTRDAPPEATEERRVYAAETLRRFADKAFRRPADEDTVERLTQLAEAYWQREDASFEAGVAHAMIAALASPRFLLRIDLARPTSSVDDAGRPYLDNYSLASRLSYFLWSTMPDDELLRLAAQGELRERLPEQLARMLKDDRSHAMTSSFVGQWLRTRDIEHISIDPLAAAGVREQYDELLDELRELFRRGSDPNLNDERREELAQRRRELRREFRKFSEIRDALDGELRRAMRDETEMLFEHIVKENRSALELLDADYTFVNEKLARHYGLAGVEGRRMRKVEIPPDSPRGGVLTHGSMLVVTSNPTRTSPVKRGLYILDNLLGMPSPPAPPGVPELEASADRFGGREPSLRELLAAHRESDLCASCHNRMDPLGLALENFNALGIWRDDENGTPIDASGALVSGETFTDVRDLRKVLTTVHRDSFYRCLSEKLLTYAIGRGLDYYDVQSVDQIVNSLRENDGRILSAFEAVVQSAPFQRQRDEAPTTNENDVADSPAM
ncbi:MAG: DUF1592 domain-containing protein, partial [Planctomycetales bacterium]|nr:DUF1592 domain-containing protein [Planctomycetales bacterium]